MKKLYSEPEMNVSTFSHEDIVTSSIFSNETVSGGGEKNFSVDFNSFDFGDWTAVL